MTRFPRSRWLALAAFLAASAAAPARAVVRHGAEEEQDVLVAALEENVRAIVRDVAPAKPPVVCVGFDPLDSPQSPSKELLARLAAPGRRVVKAGECEVRSRGVVQLGTGAAAVLASAGTVEWVAPDEAWVRVVQIDGRERSIHRLYRVVREAGGWVCLGPILKISPD